MRLYKFQKQAIIDIENGFKKHKEIILAYYTGAGKTNIFLSYCKKLIEENPNIRIAISSYITKDIKLQTLDRCKELNIDKYAVATNKYSYKLNKNIHIFIPQSYYRLDEKIKGSHKYDLVIIDEGHVGMGENDLMLNKIINKFSHKDTKFLIATATPWDLLAQKRFKNALVLKRCLDKGITDKIISDVEICAEENQIEFEESHFTRTGNLKLTEIAKRMSVVKSVCDGKFQHIIDKYGNNKLGKSVLVICPYGNDGEIAKHLAKKYGGKTFLQEDSEYSDEQYKNYLDFKKGKFKYLFVVYKCSVGFDMSELNTVIDLTMTRNIKTLVQRIGRVARKCGDKKKRFIYCYDKSLKLNRLEWLLACTIDFSIGNYEGFTTKDVKYKKIKTKHIYRRQPYITTISSIIRKLKNKNSIKNVCTFEYTTSKKPKYRTLETAIVEAKKYNNRPELYAKNAALYKWFRINGHIDELNKIHPIINNRGKWNEKTCIEAMNKCKTRKEFRDKYSGALYWLERNGKRDLLNKHVPYRLKRLKWSTDEIKKILKNEDITWIEFQKKYSGAYSYLKVIKKTREMKKYYESIRSK